MRIFLDDTDSAMITQNMWFHIKSLAERFLLLMYSFDCISNLRPILVIDNIGGRMEKKSHNRKHFWGTWLSKNFERTKNEIFGWIRSVRCGSFIDGQRVRNIVEQDLAWIVASITQVTFCLRKFRIANWHQTMAIDSFTTENNRIVVLESCEKRRITERTEKEILARKEIFTNSQ